MLLSTGTFMMSEREYPQYVRLRHSRLFRPSVNEGKANQKTAGLTLSPLDAY